MSLNNILFPNNYNLFSQSLSTVGNINVGGSVLSDNGIIFKTTPTIVDSFPYDVPVGLLNNGILIVDAAPSTSGVLQLPDAADVVETFSAVESGQVLSFTVIAGPQFAANTSGTTPDNYLAITPGSGGLCPLGFGTPPSLYLISAGISPLNLSVPTYPDIASRTYYLQIIDTTSGAEAYNLY